MFRLNRMIVSLLTLLIVGFMAACSDAPTGASAPDQMVASGSTEWFMGLDSETESRLKAELEAEKDRIKLVKELSKPKYEAARQRYRLFEKIWKAYRKTNKDATVDLLRCEPQEYHAETKVIGPGGGTLHAGEHELEIPKGALLEPTVITAEAPTTDLVEVELQPHGLVFAKRPTLTLSYKHCLQPENYRHGVVYLNDQDEVLEEIPSHDKHIVDKVEAWLQHFSRYAVMY